MEEALKITVTADKPQDNQLKAKLTIPAADVDAAIKKAYKDVASRYNFQGFRKGRAPRKIIDGIIGAEAIMAQATNDLLVAAEPLVLEELDLVPVGEFSYGDDPALVVEGADYVAEATIPVRPEAKLSSYDAPEIKMPPEEATDAEVEAQLKRLLSYQTTYEDIKPKRAAKEGDFIDVDIENVEGVEQLEGANRMLELTEGRVPAELVKGISGMKIGDEKIIAWTHAHEHDGHEHEQKFEAKVTLNAIKKAVVPELDDEVAKKSFGFDTADEVRAALREEIAMDKKATLPGLKEDRVVEAVGALLELDEVPAEYRTQVRNEFASEFLTNLQRQGISLDMFLSARGISMNDFLADLDAQAEERARQSLALDAVAAEKGFDATEQDLLAEFERSGVEDAAAAIKQWRSEGRLPAVREAVRRTKALKWLAENAKVTIVDEIAEAAAEKPAKKKAAKKASAKKEAASDEAAAE